MSRRLRLPGSREVHASLDYPEESGARERTGGSAETSRVADSGEPPDPGVANRACVVACPPHPQMGGRRSDARLGAVSDALVTRGIACLRFDYGAWDDGYGERGDARTALSWARERFEHVGLFGYSFGGTIALLAAADRADVAAVAALAPPARVAPDLDAVDALEHVACPVQLVYGERDGAVESSGLIERAAGPGCTVVPVAADHRFVGQHEAVGDLVGGFLERALESA